MKRFIPSVILAGALALGSAGAAEAGRLKGPGKAVETVQGFHTKTYKIAFEVNKPATVRVEGDGDTRLTLEVYDGRGQLVGKHLPKGRRGGLSFTPTVTGPFTVKVVNTGGVPNRYVLRTN